MSTKAVVLILASIMPLSFADAAENKVSETCFKKIYCVEAIAYEKGLRFFLRTKENYPMTLELSGDLKKQSPTPALPFSVQAQPGKRIKILEFENWSKEDIKKLVMNHRYGWTNATLSTDVMNLPFDGKNSYQVSQAYNGPWSHKDHQRYAIDFNMTEGTPVLAARDGVVAFKQMNFNQTTIVPDDRGDANQIWLLHSDGTLTAYIHLRYKSGKVDEGDLVKAGQVIAESGMTGSAKTPHLHFEAFRPMADQNKRESLATKFRLPSGRVIEAPLTGATVP